MGKIVQIFRSLYFQDDVNGLTFKESSFTYRKTRALVEMLKSDSNISHLKKIDKAGSEKPLFALKIQKDLNVLLTLEIHSISPDYSLTFLRAIRLSEMQKAVETLDAEWVCPIFKFEFGGFW